MLRSFSFRPALHALEPRDVPAVTGGLPASGVVVAPDDGGLPRVKVVNPTTGEDVAEVQAYEDAFRGGVHAALGDITGDGVNDLVIAPGAGGGPRIRILDGTDGRTLADFFVYEPTYTGGVYVALGDVNGDGRDDILTGTGLGGGPRVRVLDGATLGATVLKDYFAYEDTFRGGVQVAAGDVTGDGRADVVTGTGVGGAPRVSVFDARDDRPVRNFFAYESTFRGGVQVTAGDLDGDGRAEVIAGTGVGGGPVVRAFRADDSALVSLLADDSSFRGGVRVGVTDRDGDGRAEIVARTRRGNDDVLRLFTAAGGLDRVIVKTVDDSSAGRGGGVTLPPGVTVSVEGRVAAVDAAAGTVGLTVGGATLTVRVGPGTKVERNDVTVPLSAFQVGDFGEALVGPDGVAVKVEAGGPAVALPPGGGGGTTPPAGGDPTGTTPGANANIEGTITALDVPGRRLTITAGNGTAYLIVLAAGTRVERNDASVPLSAFRVGDFGEAKTDAAGLVFKVEAVG